ncbi:MAG: CBS domain-containing protein [Acidimicrobiia bacterium]
MPSSALVRDVMTSQVTTLRPEQSFAEAADTLADRKIGAAPVVDAEGKVVGLIRDEDFLVSESNLHVPAMLNFFGVDFPIPGQQKHFEEELKRMVAATVQDLMETEFPTAGPDETLADVATKMHEDDITHMPVVDAGGKLVGIISRGDIVRRVADTT